MQSELWETPDNGASAAGIERQPSGSDTMATLARVLTKGAATRSDRRETFLVTAEAILVL